MAVETLIIGSGVAAAALAETLLKKNPAASILILEAGPRVKTRDYGVWENYLVTNRLPYERCRDLPLPTRDLPSSGENQQVGSNNKIYFAGSRLFAYGGSTLHWGGWSLRLKPEDFRLRSAAGGGADWPFSYDEIESFYGRAEEYLAVSGDSRDESVPRTTDYPFRPFPFTLQDQPIVQAFKDLGLKYGNMPIARRGVSETPSEHARNAPCQTTGTCKYCPFGARYVASDYLDDLREWNDFPNFEIRLGAVVETLNTSEKRRVSTAQYRDQATGELVTVEAERIIIAAGAIESAKLLLRSITPEWPNGIGNDNGLVGCNFITHPYFVFTGALKANPLKLQPEMGFPTFISRHFDSAEEQRRGKFILVNPPDTVPAPLVAKMQAGFSRAEIDAYLTGPAELRLHGMIEVFGVKENRIENTMRRNRLGMLETRVIYAPPADFAARMTEIKAHVQTIYTAMGASLKDDASVDWRADHASSTCRMSKDASDGVLDADLRVHGMENLYVCSNAAFPSIGAVNPTLTLTALALRLGDHLNAGK